MHCKNLIVHPETVLERVALNVRSCQLFASEQAVTIQQSR